MNVILAVGEWLNEEPTDIEWRIIFLICIVGILIALWRLVRTSKKKRVRQEPMQQAGAGEHWLDDVDWKGDQHKSDND